ncbi:hypothetical protein GCM10011344_40840 [Dokdonia pacifica]|uniref:Uncharacterized protein n=1 Tax=Dokdonia pacifica TaxID=1627892 RepID=A0A239AC19_9FLAO|nr:hypothetical protein [Dokdonia pacifica]GGG35773.1 hypothetical protein GCM10011344_40840 [Dokdonia pacifica]SNR92433.1 hypothetical protein SAMN06265376_104269 [Dokdonia pacifica]
MKTTNFNDTNQKNSMNVYSVTKLIALCLLSLIGMISCETNDDADIITELPDDTVQIFGGLEYANSIIEARENAIQHFTIDATTGGTIIGNNGTQLHFPPNALTFLGGELVSGDVAIEFIEIYSRADMLTQNLPTNGKRDNGDIVSIISGGEFYINATQDGNQLVAETPFGLTAPTADFDPEMTVFLPEDCDRLDCDVVWEEDENANIQGGEIQNADGTWTSAYFAPLTNFGWTNLDRWWAYEDPKTLVYVDVPEGFNETNSAVYVSYDGEPNALAFFDTYDTDLDMFTEHYGQMPIGLEVHFIFVSVQDGDYVYAIQSATIGTDHIEIITTTQTTTEAGLTALINALP